MAVDLLDWINTNRIKLTMTAARLSTFSHSVLFDSQTFPNFIIRMGDDNNFTVIVLRIGIRINSREYGTVQHLRQIDDATALPI